jgi:hypothetical protein
MFAPSRRELVFGATLILAAVAMFAIWLMFPNPFLFWLALPAAIGGWFVTAASLKPRGSSTRGLVYGFVLYVLTGVGFLLIVEVRLGGRVQDLFDEPMAFLFSLLWPALLASYLGGYLGA